MKRAILRAGAVGALMLCGAPAGADEVTEARLHYQRGTVAYALGRYEVAASEYEEAFACKPDSALLYNAALAHQFAGNKKRALLLYRSYETTPLFAQRPPYLKKVAHHIAELQEAITVEEDAARSDLGPTAWPRRGVVEAPRAEAPSHAHDEATAPDSPSARFTERLRRWFGGRSGPLCGGTLALALGLLWWRRARRVPDRVEPSAPAPAISIMSARTLLRDADELRRARTIEAPPCAPPLGRVGVA